jgi:hypothetical protein
MMSVPWCNRRGNASLQSSHLSLLRHVLHKWEKRRTEPESIVMSLHSVTRKIWPKYLVKPYYYACGAFRIITYRQFALVPRGNMLPTHSKSFRYAHTVVRDLQIDTKILRLYFLHTTTLAWPIRWNRGDEWYISKRGRLSPKVKTYHLYFRAVFILMGLDCPS